MKYIMIPMMVALSCCNPVHAMDENQDCKYTKTVNQNGGEIVSSKTDYDCKTTPKVVYKESTPTVIYREGTTVSSPVTTTRVVSSTPVYYNNNHQTTNVITDIAKVIFFGGAQSKYFHQPIGNKTITVGFKNRQRGSCYANYETGGTDCY